VWQCYTQPSQHPYHPHHQRDSAHIHTGMLRARYQRIKRLRRRSGSCAQSRGVVGTF
jgi:hypothetical protein